MKKIDGHSAGKTFEIGWLECATESEGSIQLTWGKRKDGYIQLVPRVNLGNKAIGYIERAITYSKQLGFNGNVSEQKNGMKYIIWYGMKRVKRLLEALSPYFADLRKQRIAEKVLEFIDYRLARDPHVQYGEKEKELFLAVREMNGRGRIAKQELKFRFEKSKESSETNTPDTLKSEDRVRSA